MTDGQPKFVIDMIYESEHDPRSWINNLSDSKRTWKNSGLKKEKRGENMPVS